MRFLCNAQCACNGTPGQFDLEAIVLIGMRALQQCVGGGLHRRDAERIIALGDMLSIRPDTIRAVLATLEAGADIALPSCHGRYGHPVNFSRRDYAGLMGLAGDKGARCLVDRHPVREIAIDDAGILRDVDTASDLRGKFFEA